MTDVPSDKDWPIAFSDALVRALLEGRKTQSRRMPTPLWRSLARHFEAGTRCRLWVREAFAISAGGDQAAVVYRATAVPRPDLIWRSPRYMPRAHSRLTLVVTEVRHERLRRMPAADVAAEGATEAAAFRALWDRLHPKAGARWADDPEVYVLGFRVAAGNIDHI